MMFPACCRHLLSSPAVRGVVSRGVVSIHMDGIKPRPHGFQPPMVFMPHGVGRPWFSPPMAFPSVRWVWYDGYAVADMV
ncbi:hypothetical protein BGC30_04295 [Novacetimonas hansenii]|nr:hypothetical protein BGC30_04295 [Novacetimonas hansenii]